MENKGFTGLDGLWIRFRNWWYGYHREPHVSFPKHIIHTLFMAFAGKTRRAHITLPENFDLAHHKSQYPPENYEFRYGVIFRDSKVLYILHLLSSIPARNSDLITADGYIPINAHILQYHIKDYRLYINYLVNTDVLYCDNYYITGKKSLGYRWSDQYANSTYHAVEALIGDYENSQKDTTVDRSRYPYLFYWYDQKKLQIDDRADVYAESIRRIKMEDTTQKSWDWNKDKNQYKNPQTQYMAVIRNISKIKNQEYDPHIDDNIHRLHSVLTNIQKDFRNFITYDGKQLVGIDIKNCQPYLTCLLLNPEFWQENSNLPLNLYTLPSNIQTLFQSPSISIMIGRFFASLSPGEIEEYKQMVSSGMIYEHIGNIANSQLSTGQSPITRSDAKVLMFYLLFSSNQGQHEDPMINHLKRKFSTELYPKIAELFRIIKRNYPDCDMEDSHSRLSRMLQSIESNIILHRCCRRIWEEKQQSVPVFTIHDSIVTTSEHQSYVHSVMSEEFNRYIGIPPALSVEIWDMANLNQELLHS